MEGASEGIGNSVALRAESPRLACNRAKERKMKFALSTNHFLANAANLSIRYAR